MEKGWNDRALIINFPFIDFQILLKLCWALRECTGRERRGGFFYDIWRGRWSKQARRWYLVPALFLEGGRLVPLLVVGDVVGSSMALGESRPVGGSL